MKRITVLTISLLLVLAIVPAVLAAQADIEVIPLGVPGTFWEDFELGVRGGQIIHAMISNPRTFNPIVADDTASWWVPERTQMPLIERCPHTQLLEGALARSFEISEDGLSITFHLRRGLRWSDGAPFTAADVMFTFVDLWLNTEVAARRVVWTLPDGTLPSFEKIDNYTVVAHFSVIFRPALEAVGTTILPRHKLWEYVRKLNPALETCQFNTKAWSIAMTAEDMAGMGAWKFDRFITDMEIRLVRNPYFWKYDPAGTQLPYLDRKIVRIVPSIDVALLLFRNGEIDTYGPRPEDLAILKGEAAARRFTVRISDIPVWGMSFFTFNQDVPGNENLRGLFRDLRFRRAVAHAIDTDAIIDGIFMGLATPQWSHVGIPSPFFAGDEYATWFEFDLDKAAALLADIGLVDLDGDGWLDFPDGSRVSFVLITNAGHTIREAKSLMLADDLAEIGVEAITSFIPFAALVGHLLGATYEAVMIGFTGGVDPHGARVIYHSTGGLHFWRFSAGGPAGRHPAKFPVADPAEWNPRVDELFDLGAGTFDEIRAKAYYHEMQLIIREHLPLIFTSASLQMAAVFDRIGNGLWETMSGIWTGAGVTGSQFAFRRDL